jgi:UDP-N-acetylglucosamine diphosphorylase / glucose-1-phosphate thymidylyltransferase / UDP-N-acetylgalactosamine diphosphorylase / glucosamine-1-phosphate N-acetyltransferase / galactosamine-1-phosphate N-acetyltransferase
VTAAVDLAAFVEGIASSPLARRADLAPWDLVRRAEAIVRELLVSTGGDFEIRDDIAIHRSATIEAGAVLKGPLIIGARCFVASGAYLRGANWIAEDCTIGPGCELKSSFVFAGAKLAHFNFVGDSIVGADVNLEAGSIVCNHRNERADKEIRVRIYGSLHATGCEKFGALIGDRSRIGANAVLAPGVLLAPGSIVARASLRDDEAG